MINCNTLGTKDEPPHARVVHVNLSVQLHLCEG